MSVRLHATADAQAPSDWTELDRRSSQEITQVCEHFGLTPAQDHILVNIDTQRLHLASQDRMRSYPVSTALNGAGQEAGTGRTPLGLHFIESKIGDGADPYRVFESRVPTGEIAMADVGEKRIVGRILWLQGAQPGFNQGMNSEGTVVDSHARYIYIHGTNDIANIGTPVSGGCIRMKPADVVDLFQQVHERTPVQIYKA